MGKFFSSTKSSAIGSSPLASAATNATNDSLVDLFNTLFAHYDANDSTSILAALKKIFLLHLTAIPNTTKEVIVTLLQEKFAHDLPNLLSTKFSADASAPNKNYYTPWMFWKTLMIIVPTALKSKTGLFAEIIRLHQIPDATLGELSAEQMMLLVSCGLSTDDCSFETIGAIKNKLKTYQLAILENYTEARKLLADEKLQDKPLTKWFQSSNRHDSVFSLHSLPRFETPSESKPGSPMPGPHSAE